MTIPVVLSCESCGTEHRVALPLFGERYVRCCFRWVIAHVRGAPDGDMTTGVIEVHAEPPGE